jgi:N-acetylated-alpha-linked acidic dipeptidase
VSVLDRLRAHVRVDAYAGTGKKPEDTTALDAAKAGGDMPLGPLGAGSDYSAFLQHLGIPSLDLAFGGEGGGGGSYHSAYDTFYHVTKFDDPGLIYGAVLSKMVGRLVLRAADAPRVPARYADFATTVSRYVDEVKKLAADQREKDRVLRNLTRENGFKLASHPDDPTIAPEDKGVTPLIDMLALEDAADRLARSAHAADAAVERITTLSPADQSHIVTLLRDIDQLLVDRAGLPGRPWYRNLIYAPGTLTGYGAKTLPGVREAIEQRRLTDATAYVARTAAVLNAYSDRLDAAAKLAH